MKDKRLFDLIYDQQLQFPLDECCGARYDGKWRFFSTDEVIEQARQLAQGLIEAGIEPGQCIATVIYQNRPEFLIADLAIMQAGAINVPLYPTISVEEYEFILQDSGTVMAFVGGQDLYEKVAAAKEKCPDLKNIYTFDKQGERPHWETLLHDGQAEAMEKRMHAIQPGDLATLIYTSGTTGKPKGVMLSHSNILASSGDVAPIIPLEPGDTCLSFLPLCHVFERTASYTYVRSGYRIAFTGTGNLGGEEGDLRAVRPHFFTTVPRLLEKVYERIYHRGEALSGLKRQLFFWALNLTDNYDFDKRFGPIQSLQWSLADRLVFSKWREALGGRVKGIVTGAAPCPARIIRIFSAAGIPVREAYGLTESSPGLTGNSFEPGGAMLGSAGKAFNGVRLRLDESAPDLPEGEGEILATGPNIMLGYYNREAATNEVLFEENGERWLRTGDIGTFRKGPNGVDFLFITDRKKELLKTSGGKYVAPTPIENRFKESFLIEQMMIIGDKRKFISALIIPSEETLMEWCEKQDLPIHSLEEAVQHEAVVAHYQEIIDGINPELNRVDQIKKFRLLATQWEPETTDGSPAELTPTMKLKRRVILQKYASEIEELYG